MRIRGGIAFTAPAKATLAVVRIVAGMFNFPENTALADEAADLFIPLTPGYKGATARLKLAGEGIVLVGMSVFFTDYKDHIPQVIRNRAYIASEIVGAALVRQGQIIPYDRNVMDPEEPVTTFKPRSGAAWETDEEN